MNIPRSARARSGRFHHEYPIMLALMVVVCVVLVRILAPEQTPDPRPFWDRVLASLLGLLQCFGIFVGGTLLLASVELIKQTAAGYQQRRIDRKRTRLAPLLRDAAAAATPANLAWVVRLLGDPHDTVRREALSASFTLLRTDPGLVTPRLRADLERAFLDEPGFARTLAETPPDASLVERVTLGAKLGAGTCEKRLAPVTSDPAELARWVETHRHLDENQEIQVSIGYDTGPLPWLVERGRFLALYLYIASTDLGRFQALVRRPPRDPNAAYGLLIRGDIIEVRFPGQARGRRLDYVFPLPPHLNEGNLTAFLRQLQLLNLGLLIACAEDGWRTLVPGAMPPWLDARRLALSRVYRQFERRFVAHLRRHDRHRDPDRIHRLLPADHAERVRAFQLYRLEECLYPEYSWVVPLYDPDTRWDRLLAPLRAVEAMMLHQGEVDQREATRGLDFIQQVRRLGYESSQALEQTLAGDEAPSGTGLPPDPFIDAAEEEATVSYLRRVTAALATREAAIEDLPDPAVFRRACAYYQIEGAEPPGRPREVSRRG